jgi:2-keto-4-pentenoate hydratase/2-oxohepta-3-ene-1,7-dioic acid hydratase in catechol pathway
MQTLWYQLNRLRWAMKGTRNCNRNAGHRIKESDPCEYIAGYVEYNDGSDRKWQQHTTQCTSGNNFDATGSFGPWLVIRDEWRRVEPCYPAERR